MLDPDADSKSLASGGLAIPVVLKTPEEWS